ncbi:acyltransferase [Mesorhizobium sp. B2-4-17]|uniref:acyltransferase family protein n=1 Tax=Mesorhizobium sp. B2-4-17 TaxID=2589932 RepID=UPI0015E3B900|nr:acyltransferase [Mesorhizobium sp. B2-4-17]
MGTIVANGLELAGAIKRPQLHSLTALRAFAALSIFFHHLTTFGIDSPQSILSTNLNLGVSFFFVLSGFVLSYSFDGEFQTPRDVRNFIFQRFFRLWPLHILCAFLAAASLWNRMSLVTAYLVTTLQNAWVPTYGTAYAYNGVSWSISVELFFYLALPFILSLRPRFMMLLISGWTLAALGLLAFTVVLPRPVFPLPSEQWWLDLYITDESFAQFFPPLRMVEFLSGMAAYQLFKRRRIPDAWVAFCQIGAIVCLVGYMRVHAIIVQFFADHSSDMAHDAYRAYGMYPLFAIAIYIFGHQSGMVARVLSCRPLVFCGEVSFAFYMIHQIVIRNLADNFEVDKEYGPLVATIAAAMISFLFSVLLHRTVERPCIDWAKRRFPMSKRARPLSAAPVAALA